jgi:hypothetical protein
MSLVANYPCQDALATNVILGAVGPNGTYDGGQTTAARSVEGPGGSIPLALTFDGVSDSASVTLPGATGAWSFAIWLKIPDGTTSGNIAGRSNSNTSVAYGGLGTVTNRLLGVNNVCTLAEVMRQENWTHIAVTRDGSNDIRVYIDGVLQADVENEVGTIVAMTWLAKTGAVVSKLTLADVRIYDHALNQSEVDTIRAVGITAATPSGIISAFQDTFRTTTGIDAFTVTGQGNKVDQDAVLGYGNIGVTLDTAIDGAHWGWGFSTAYNSTFSTACRLDHGQTVNAQGHEDDDTGLGFLIARNGTTLTSITHRAKFNAPVTNGFNTNVTTALGTAAYFQGLLFTGVSNTYLDNHLMPFNVSDTVDINFGFTPTFVVVWSSTDQFSDASTGHPGMSPQCIAIILPDGKIICQAICWRKSDGVAGTPTACYGSISDDELEVWDPSPGGDTTQPDWRWTPSWTNSTTLRFTGAKKGGDTEQPEAAVFAVNLGASWQAQVGYMTTPTSTGSKAFSGSDFSNSISFTPSTMLFLLSMLTAVNTNRADHNEAGTVGMAAATNPTGIAAGQIEWCATQSCERNVTTTNSQSLVSADLFNVPQHDGSAGLRGTLTSLDSGGLTVNFSAVTGTALKIPFLAIGPAASGQPTWKRFGGVKHAARGMQGVW